jgi:hypothetical protein
VSICIEFSTNELPFCLKIFGETGNSSGESSGIAEVIRQFENNIMIKKRQQIYLYFSKYFAFQVFGQLKNNFDGMPLV